MRSLIALPYVADMMSGYKSSSIKDPNPSKQQPLKLQAAKMDPWLGKKKLLPSLQAAP